MAHVNTPHQSHRATTIRVTQAVSADGLALAEDMHGIECHIDLNTTIDVAASLGLILDAEIGQDGHVKHASSRAAILS